MQHKKNKIISALLAFTLALSLFDFKIVNARELIKAVEGLIINQVYGGGGKGDTPISHSFIEIYNPTNEAVSVDGWSIQYASNRASGNLGSTNNLWVKKDLNGVIPPKTSYLIRAAAETTTEELLKYNITDKNTDLNWEEQFIDNNQYRVALVNNDVLLEENNVFGQDNVVDLVSVKEDGENTSAPSISKQKSIRRKNFTDTNNNGSDFEEKEYKGASEEFISSYRPRSLNDGVWENEVVNPEEPGEGPNPEDGDTPKPPVVEDLFDKTPVEDTVNVEKIAGFFTGSSSKDGGAAEIVKFNKDNNKFYVIDGVSSKIHVVSLDSIDENDYTNLEAEKTISVKEIVEVDGFSYGDITSISINTDKDEIAVAVQEADYSKNGKIVVIDYDGNYKSEYNAGVQPDMITYSPNGKYILTANEGEPRNGLGGANVDPEGTVTIVDIEKNTVSNIGFENAKLDSLVHLRKDLNGNKIDAKYDLEPEYIAVDESSTTAYVSLQENNAIAIIDIENGKVVEVKGLGYKDYSLEDNALDAARDNKIIIEQLPIKGLYMPDSITYYNGYIITANEGDATEWGKGENAFENTDSFKNIKLRLTSLDVNNFGGYNTQADLDAKLDEMKASTDYDKLEVVTDIDDEAIYVLGGRSFSIWKADTMELVFDSGKDFETITAQRYPEYFNISNDKNEKDARSTKKGPEPEEVKIGQVGSKTYAFIALERIGGVMTYDITDINNVKFSNYINTRDFSSAYGGDSAPESIDFIHGSLSTTGYPLLVVANEVSGTVAVLQINEGYVEETKEVKLFHTNDTHSRVDNFSKLQGYINKYQGEYLLLDAGDTFHGQSFATLEEGSSIAKILKAMGYDAVVPGNHDFNYGQERLLELGEEANLPILAVNIKKDGQGVYEEGLIKEVNGVKVGLLGIATPETAYKTNPNNVVGLDFGNLDTIIADTQNTVNKLKTEGAEVIVALSHLGIDDASDVKITDVAANVSGIDVVIDGHSHSTLEEYQEFNKVNKTQITSTGEYLESLGEITLVLNKNNEVLEVKLERVDTETLTDKDENIEKLINDIKDAQKPILDVVVGKTPITLDGARENVRNGHTNLGRLITSAMLDETGAEIALTNGGGIRDSIQAGDITKGDVIKVLPFGNYIVTKKMKGEDIVAALEHGMVQGAGSFTHFAGMEVTVEKYTDVDGKIRNKVLEAKVNGESIDLNKEYVVATNDFMAVGGDGYSMFSQYPTLNEYSAMDEALTSYINKVGEEGILLINNEERLKEDVVSEEEEKEEDNNDNSSDKEEDKPDVESKPEEDSSIEDDSNTNYENEDKENLPNTGGRNTIIVVSIALIITVVGITLCINKNEDIA